MAPKIKVFTICKQILDLFGVSDEQLKKRIPKERDELSEIFRTSQLNGQQEGIDYDDEIVQFCYIQKYMAFRVKVIEFLVGSDIVEVEEQPLPNRVQSKNRVTLFFDRNEIRVLSIGCGPGTEMVGILKYCIENDLHPNIHFDLFDKYDWADTIGKVRSVLENLDFEKKPKFTCEFEKGLDFTIAVEQEVLDCAKSANLVIFCWSMSDFKRECSYVGRVVENFIEVFDNVEVGTYFIIVDTNRLNAISDLLFEDVVWNSSETIRNVDGPMPFHIDVKQEPIRDELGRYFDGHQQLDGPIEPLMFVK